MSCELMEVLPFSCLDGSLMSLIVFALLTILPRVVPSAAATSHKEQGDDNGLCVKRRCVWVDAYDSPLSE
eukprot:11245569-Karenia_brevis.AAC.1